MRKKDIVLSYSFKVTRSTERELAVYEQAPQLLKAAKFALICLNAANETLGGWASEEYYKECREELRTVVAKAEGKE